MKKNKRLITSEVQKIFQEQLNDKERNPFGQQMLFGENSFKHVGFEKT